MLLNLSGTWTANSFFSAERALRQYFSLYRAVPQREGERKEIDRREKNVEATPPTPSTIGPCPTILVGRPGNGS